MSSLPLVSIIIPNHNGKHYLENCLSAISQINYPSERYEVILVDNGSSDGSINFVQQKFPWVKILALNKNYGFATGNNKGTKFAKGNIFVFLNNDTVVDNNWLAQLVQVIINENIDVCGSRVLSMRKPNTAQYAGGYLHLIGGAIFMPLHKGEPTKSWYPVGSICGASFAIKRYAFESLDGFDDDFFIYAEEGDLCLRALIRGYKIAYAPYSVVYHHAGGSTAGSKQFQNHSGDSAYFRLLSPLTVYYGNRNSLVLLLKSFQARNLPAGVTFSYLYLFVQLILLLGNKQSEAKLLIRASYYPFINLRKIWRKRLLVQERRKVSDGWLIKSGFLLSIGETLKLRAQLKKAINN